MKKIETMKVILYFFLSTIVVTFNSYFIFMKFIHSRHILLSLMSLFPVIRAILSCNSCHSAMLVLPMQLLFEKQFHRNFVTILVRTKHFISFHHIHCRNFSFLIHFIHPSIDVIVVLEILSCHSCHSVLSFTQFWPVIHTNHICCCRVVARIFFFFVRRLN